MTENNVVNQTHDADETDEGAHPLVWGAGLSLLTLAFVAALAAL